MGFVCDTLKWFLSGVRCSIFHWDQNIDHKIYTRVTVALSCSGCLRRTAKVTVYPKKYAHGFVVLCFVVVMQSFIMNSHEVFIHIHQGCFAGAIVRLPQCQWSKPDGFGKISQYITTTKHSKTKTVCIFLGIYCMFSPLLVGLSMCLFACQQHYRKKHRQIFMKFSG